MSARVSDADYDALQHFITDSPWDWRASQDGLLRVMRDEASDASGLLVVDDVPLVKQGDKSPGVARQYCGVTGGVDNCQAIVDAVYVLPRSTPNRETLAWCYGMEVYIPKAWASDPARCQEAGIPTPVTFEEKWRIALRLIDRARQFDVPHRAVVADMFYGDCREFRKQLREWKEAYVMAVTPSELRVVSSRAPILHPGERYPGRTGGRPFVRAHLPEGVRAESAREVAARSRDWVRIRWAKGTKEPLEGWFARAKVRVCAAQEPTDEIAWLLMEDHPDGLKTWLCWGHPHATIEELAAMAHGRWPIERFHEEAKMELGLDHFEGRRWRGLNHHLTITLMAHTFLVLEQKRAREEQGNPGEMPTLAEARRETIREVVGELLRSIATPPTEEDRLAEARRITEMWVRIA